MVIPEEPACKVCGYDYVLGLQEDEERHSRFHDEEEKGPSAQMNDGIHIVSLEDSPTVQRIAEQAFRVGNRETCYEFPLFTVGERSTNEPVAAIEIMAGRAIAGVLTRLRSCEQRAHLADFKQGPNGDSWAPAHCVNIERHQRRAIEFIWVHKKHRGQNALVRSLNEIERYFSLSLSDFSHSLPFTRAALKFWRKRPTGMIYLARPFSDLPEDWPYAMLIMTA